MVLKDNNCILLDFILFFTSLAFEFIFLKSRNKSACYKNEQKRKHSRLQSVARKQKPLSLFEPSSAALLDAFCGFVVVYSLQSKDQKELLQ